MLQVRYFVDATIAPTPWVLRGCAHQPPHRSAAQQALLISCSAAGERSRRWSLGGGGGARAGPQGGVGVEHPLGKKKVGTCA